jgi:hypothetical protein
MTMRIFVTIFIVLAVVSASTVQADLGRVIYLHSDDLAKSSADGALALQSRRLVLKSGPEPSAPILPLNRRFSPKHENLSQLDFKISRSKSDAKNGLVRITSGKSRSVCERSNRRSERCNAAAR